MAAYRRPNYDLRFYQVITIERVDAGAADEREHAVDLVPVDLDRARRAGLARDRCSV